MRQKQESVKICLVAKKGGQRVEQKSSRTKNSYLDKNKKKSSKACCTQVTDESVSDRETKIKGMIAVEEIL